MPLSNAIFLAVMIMETIASIFLLQKASWDVQGKQREAMKMGLWTGKELASQLEEKTEYPAIFSLFHCQI